MKWCAVAFTVAAACLLVYASSASAVSCAPWNLAPQPVCKPAGSVVTLAEVRALALVQSARAGDNRPTSVLVARGTLRTASRVMDPAGVLYPDPTPQETVELDSDYYLIVIRGRFPLAPAEHSEKHEVNHRPSTYPYVPTVLELLMSVHHDFGLTGFAYGSQAPRLGRLGHVTHLL